MRMFLCGQWQDRPEKIDVTNPYDGRVIDTVPRGTSGDVDKALATLVEGAKAMRAMPAYDRSRILRKAAALMLEREKDLGRIVSTEEGKILAEGVFEASRARETIDVSADEAKRISSEVVPLDAAPGGQGKFGFTLRVPCGIVAAITPFNFPLNLVAHKVGPAIAAGNAVILKHSDRNAFTPRTPSAARGTRVRGNSRSMPGNCASDLSPRLSMASASGSPIAVARNTQLTIKCWLCTPKAANSVLVRAASTRAVASGRATRTNVVVCGSPKARTVS
jgi:glyceraldehyde-3-phosphate dehydrogenase (NADP+)